MGERLTPTGAVGRMIDGFLVVRGYNPNPHSMTTLSRTGYVVVSVGDGFDRLSVDVDGRIEVDAEEHTNG